jgi:hypothetical protein
MIVDRQLFRQVNDRLYELNVAFGTLTGDVVVVCECPRLDCIEPIRMTLCVYARLQEEAPRAYVVVDGHDDAATILMQHDGFGIVRAP